MRNCYGRDLGRGGDDRLDPGRDLGLSGRRDPGGPIDVSRGPGRGRGPLPGGGPCHDLGVSRGLRRTGTAPRHFLVGSLLDGLYCWKGGSDDRLVDWEYLRHSSTRNVRHRDRGRQSLVGEGLLVGYGSQVKVGVKNGWHPRPTQRSGCSEGTDVHLPSLPCSGRGRRVSLTRLTHCPLPVFRPVPSTSDTPSVPVPSEWVDESSE